MSNSPDRKPSAKRRRLLKRRLAARDGAQCFYCREPFGPGLEGATVDHLIPRSLLHTWAQAALVLACYPCNEAKGTELPQTLLRPAAGQFGPGLVPIGDPNAQAPTHPHAQARTRVREEGPL
ncbi:HNH endonuclease, partial [Streptomyces sp. NPDC059618]|uniref:HNH endonuclease n=1 Tax=Streptomyces sp. NPDC059618 TaxID=3346887 RepID=UPI0036B5A2A9